MKPESRRATGGFVLGCLLVGGLASCSKDPTPSSPTTPPTTTISTNTASTSANPPGPSTTTPTPTGPYDPIPEAARQHTNDGAVAFATFWVEQVDHAFQAPNPGAISRLCTPEAQLCQTIEDSNQNLSATGHHSTSSVWSIERHSVRAPAVANATQVQLTLHHKPYQIADSTGKVVKTYGEKYSDILFTLTWISGGWMVTQLSGMKQ